MRIGQIVIDVRPLRESRDFRWTFAGRFVSGTGSAVALAAASWQVYVLTRSSLDVGLVSVADGLGSLAGLLAGGMLADRHDRRRLLLAVQPPQTLLALLLLVNSLAVRPSLGAVYALMLGLGVLDGLGSPALAAALPALVGGHRLAPAAALNATASQVGRLVGPAAAGLLIADFGLPACYLADAACFALFAAALSRVRPLPPSIRARRPGPRSLAQGFGFIRRSGVVGGILLADTNAMIFGMPTALFPAFATQHFHGGSATYGLLAAAPGVGALVGAATSGWTGRVRRPGLVVLGSGLAWGAAIAAFGLTGNLVLALGCLGVAGMGDLVSEVLRNALMQIYTPDRLRGRVASLYLAQVTTAPALGNVEAGAVAQAFTPTISVVSGGLACAVGTVLIGALIPALRHAALRPASARHSETAAPAEAS